MINFIAKFAPKQSYGSTMLLNNRVIVAVSVQNVGIYVYWSKVYNWFDMKMYVKFSILRQSRDKEVDKRRKCQSKVNFKKSSVEVQNKKIKYLMTKLRIDTLRGATYGSDIVLPSILREVK